MYIYYKYIYIYYIYYIYILYIYIINIYIKRLKDEEICYPCLKAAKYGVSAARLGYGNE